MRSYDRDTTKGGHADVIPIATERAPYLKAAIETSPSERVFPAADGAMMSKEVGSELVHRRALGRAGIVQGYSHVCRARVDAQGRRDPRGAAAGASRPTRTERFVGAPFMATSSGPGRLFGPSASTIFGTRWSAS